MDLYIHSLFSLQTEERGVWVWNNSYTTAGKPIPSGVKEMRWSRPFLRGNYQAPTSVDVGVLAAAAAIKLHDTYPPTTICARRL
jgi:hypothetical protein